AATRNWVMSAPTDCERCSVIEPESAAPALRTTFRPATSPFETDTGIIANCGVSQSSPRARSRYRPGGTFAIENAPSHSMRLPNPVPGPGRPDGWLSGVRTMLPVDTGVPSDAMTWPVTRAVRTSSTPKLMSSVSELNETVSGRASAMDSTPG